MLILKASALQMRMDRGPEEFETFACVFIQTPSPVRVLPLIQEGELFIAQQIKNSSCS